MLMKANKKWLWVCVVSLGMVISQVNATGIPVVDGAATIQRQTNHAATIAQMVKEALETAANWKRNFEEMVRGKFGNLNDMTFKENDSFGQEQYLATLTKIQKKCDRIANKDSRNLCIQMIDIDKDKVKLFYSSMKDIDAATAALNAAVKNQNAQSRSGQSQTAENEVEVKLDNLKKIMDKYEFQLKILDKKQEFKQKARETIAQEQMTGTNLVSNITKGAVAAAVQTAASSKRDKTDRLRRENSRVSDNAFSQYSK